MPFRLKNARATYKRLVDTIFEGKMGSNLEAYVDDMVIKKAEEAFQAMKKLIAELPILMNPKNGEELMVYLSAANEAVTVVLVVERDRRHAPIHYVSRTLQDIWKLYTDEASNEHGSRAGLILIDLKGTEYSYALRLNFANSNNDAEYEALLAGLRIATKMKVEKMHAFVDSKLVANQVEGSYEAKGEKTKKYKEKALEMVRSFNNFQIIHIPREENRKSDALSKLTVVQCEGLTKGVLIEELNERSVDTTEVNAIIEEATSTWMKPIQGYIEHGILPEDAAEA
ncbi:reverse transcriptase domain-containing protein [Tanacetum coccineum]